MKNKIATLAILLSLSASLAFAGEKNKSESTGSGDSQPAITAPGAEVDQGSIPDQNPCVTSQPKKKAKDHKKQEPTDQEKEFDRVLMGIFG
jgi:hypothetical protein